MTQQLTRMATLQSRGDSHEHAMTGQHHASKTEDIQGRHASHSHLITCNNISRRGTIMKTPLAGNGPPPQSYRISSLYSSFCSSNHHTTSAWRLTGEAYNERNSFIKHSIACEITLALPLLTRLPSDS